MASQALISAPLPPRWVLDLNSAPPARTKASSSLANPPDYNASTPSNSVARSKSKQPARTAPTTEEMDKLKLKKAWEIAIAPAKQLPMNAFGMYMTGNSLQIFSIMMVFMLFKGPIQALLNVQQAFARLETDGNRSQMLGVKAAYVACNLLALGLGVWKVNGMGLLPTTRSDWLAWETAREPLERAFYVP